MALSTLFEHNSPLPEKKELPVSDVHLRYFQRISLTLSFCCKFKEVDICFRYALGVYDKKTEVMKIYDTEMITLQPQILGNDLMNSLIWLKYGTREFR